MEYYKWYSFFNKNRLPWEVDPTLEPTYEDVQAIITMEYMMNEVQRQKSEQKQSKSKMGNKGGRNVSTSRERIK